MRKQIKKFFLNFIYKKEIKKKKNKFFAKISKKPVIIAVIVDSRMNLNMNDFNFLFDIFNVSKGNINFLWYKSPLVHHHSNHLGINIDDISFTGKLSEEYDLFFNKNYDILINVYRNNSIFIKSLSIKVKHSFAIGFTPVDPELNDIVFDFNPENINIFKTELVKYLNIIYK